MMMDINEEWITDNGYLSIEERSYHEYRAKERLQLFWHTWPYEIMLA
jgi:hypothetical protein